GEWKRMRDGGKRATASKAAKIPAKPGRIRTAVLIAAWPLLGLWVSAPENHAAAAYGHMATCFGALSLWGFGKTAFGIIRWASGTSPTASLGNKPDASGAVSQCLPVARSSPSIDHIVAELPSYCRALLGPHLSTDTE